MIARQILLLIVICISTLTFAGPPRCATMEKWNIRTAQNPELLQQREELEEFTRNYIENFRQNGPLGEEAVVTIPVVVHVVYKTGDQNVSDAQIYSQIKVLTADYRRTNADTIKTPVFFKPNAADAEIEFCLAAIDPNGNATTGITRTSTSKTAVGDINNDNIYFSSKGGKDPWNTSKYLNIWVCEVSTDFSILGYSNLPGNNPDPRYDGLVIDYRAFGTLGTATNPFNLGRTATHEIGHFFNLEHIWGVNESNPSCNKDDGVSDTPKTDGPFYNCPSHPQTSCGNTAMFMNYMDYVDDKCMNLFTAGQKARMQASLSSNARKTLKNAVACASAPTPVVDNPFDAVKFEVFPNPAVSFANLSISAPARLRMDLSIVDIVGHEYWHSEMSAGDRNWLIDVSQMPSGIYFLQMAYEGNSKSVKFMVFHP